MGIIRNFLRLIKIIYILAKHNALSPLKNLEIAPVTAFLFSLISVKTTNLREGQRIARALEELGPIFIKVGQALSTRADLIGNELAEDLATLQDKLPSFPFPLVKKIIESELKYKLAEIYFSFNETPIAAASIAQVHKATTIDGNEVAVKVLRPNIEEAFKRDIDLFYFIAHQIEKKGKNSKRYRALEVVKNFERGVKLELDLRLEAASASELKENCKNDKGLYIPTVDWGRTSKRVLTLEWVDGVSIYDIEKLKEKNFCLKELASQITLLFFNQAFRDGFFHADLHPGNILVNNEGKIVLIDFGIMGRLDKQTKIYVAEILYGFLKRDYNYVAKVHFNAGFVEKDKSIYAFAQNCRAIGEPIVGMPVNKISIAQLLAQLFKITEEFDMPIQPKLILLQKTVMLVEGIGYKLNADINMWKLVEPWIEDWAIENIGIEAKLKDTVKDMIDYIFKELPKKSKRESIIY